MQPGIPISTIRFVPSAVQQVRQQLGRILGRARAPAALQDHGGPAAPASMACRISPRSPSSAEPIPSRAAHVGGGRLAREEGDIHPVGNLVEVVAHLGDLGRHGAEGRLDRMVPGLGRGAHPCAAAEAGV